MSAKDVTAEEKSARSNKRRTSQQSQDDLVPRNSRGGVLVTEEVRSPS